MQGKLAEWILIGRQLERCSPLLFYSLLSALSAIVTAPPAPRRPRKR